MRSGPSNISKIEVKRKARNKAVIALVFKTDGIMFTVPQIKSTLTLNDRCLTNNPP